MSETLPLITTNISGLSHHNTQKRALWVVFHSVISPRLDKQQKNKLVCTSGNGGFSIISIISY